MSILELLTLINVIISIIHLALENKNDTNNKRKLKKHKK